MITKEYSAAFVRDSQQSREFNYNSITINYLFHIIEVIQLFLKGPDPYPYTIEDGGTYRRVDVWLQSVKSIITHKKK